MLNKDICHRCFVNEGQTFGLGIPGVTPVFDIWDEIHSFICARPPHSSIFVDGEPPEDCPYVTEHIATHPDDDELREIRKVREAHANRWANFNAYLRPAKREK